LSLVSLAWLNMSWTVPFFAASPRLTISLATQIVFNFVNVLHRACQVVEWPQIVTASACSICACSKLNKSVRPGDNNSLHKMLTKMS
jgi:hypothetical protein